MRTDRGRKPTKEHRWLLAMCMSVLFLSNWFSVRSAAHVPLLGTPPAWSERPFIPQGSGDVKVFLPLVMRPPESPPWVDTQSIDASLLWYQQEYLGSDYMDADWTGDHDSCSAGETSATFLAAVLRRINYYRSMAGIPPLAGWDASYNYKAQAAALMMSVNDELSHSPDETWECYTTAGDEGAGSSNLYLGIYGPAAIRGYIYDPGTSNTSVGHRRWILYPQTQYMGTGDIPQVDDYRAANALWVFDEDNMWGPRPETRDLFVAWPPPGYVPYLVVYPRWSFAIDDADFGQASVSMTCVGQSLAVVQYTPVYGYGENTLVWEPQTSFTDPPAEGITCQVTVSQVLIGGQPQSFTYTVIIFDPD